MEWTELIMEKHRSAIYTKLILIQFTPLQPFGDAFFLHFRILPETSVRAMERDQIFRTTQILFTSICSEWL